MPDLEEAGSSHPQTLTAAIFDVDGVLLASPHERAWREALIGFAEPARFTTAMYQADVAGKPRLAAPLPRWRHWVCRMPSGRRAAYAERKQKRLEELIHAGRVAAFPDALRFVQAVAALGWPMAVASSSKNANRMMRPIRLDVGPKPARRVQRQCLRSRSAARQAGPRDFPAGRRGTARSRPRTASWSRTRPPASRLPAPAAWRRSASPG